MAKNKPFIHLFLFYFTAVTLFTVIVFILAGLKIMDRSFLRYSDMIHAETQQVLLAKVSMYYMMNNTWEGFGGKELGEAAAKGGDYFTVKDVYGSVVYSSEELADREMIESRHAYTQTEMPVRVDGTLVGTFTGGYFANFATSSEEEAFRKGSIFLVILSVFAISFIGATVSVLFFYRLSKPVDSIAKTAEDMSKGDLESRIVIKSNVKEMNQIAGSINYLGESLLNQEKYRRELTRELSHELRTPLQILLNQTEAILDGIYPADEERMEAMHTEVTRLTHLIGELEDRLMYDSDTFDIVIAPVDLSMITKKLCVGYQGSAAKKGLIFNCDIEPGITHRVDKARYAQAVVNILSNAMKYTDSGSVSLSLKRADGDIRLSVTDTGEGVEERDMDKIFERFYHSDSPKAGRGVGLYLVKQIADRHGWVVRVESKRGAGTEVEIMI